MTDLELFVLLDADGNYVTSHDRDNLMDEWDSVIGDTPVHPTRVFTIKLKVPMPVATNLAAVVPESVGGAVPVEMEVV